MVNTNVQNDFNLSTKLYCNDLKKYSPITDREEERRLLKEAKEGNIKSRNKIINAHLRYVFDVAKKYRGKGVNINDLISEGNTGIIIAIDKFDMTNETKFITYAIFWIRERMITAIEETGKRMYKERSLENIIQVDTPKTKDLSDGDDKVSTIEKLFPEEHASYDKRLNVIDRLISALDQKEKYVITSCYGIGCNPMSLKNLSKSLNLSAERIRQIKISGIHKMRRYALLAEDSSSFFRN